MAGINIKKLLVEIGGDESGLKKAARSAEADLKKVKAEASAGGSVFQNLFGKVSGDLKGKFSGSGIGTLASELTQGTAAAARFAGPIGLAIGAAIGLGAAATGAAVGLFELAKSGAEVGGSIGSFETKTGLTAESVSALAYGASLMGKELSDLQRPLIALSTKLGDAAAGSKKAKAEFAQLGVTKFDDLDGAFAQVVKGIAAIPPGVERINAAVAVFGKKGAADMLSLIAKMHGDFDAFKRTAADLGLTLSEDDVKAAKEFNHAFETVEYQIKILSAKFALQYIPTITGAIEGIEDFLSRNQASFAFWGGAVERYIGGVASAAENAARWIYAIGEATYHGTPVDNYVRMAKEAADAAQQLAIARKLAGSSPLGDKQVFNSETMTFGLPAPARDYENVVDGGGGGGKGKTKKLSEAAKLTQQLAEANKLYTATIQAGYQTKLRDLETVQDTTKNYTELAKIMNEFGSGLPQSTDPLQLKTDLRYWQAVQEGTKQAQALLDNYGTTLEQVDQLLNDPIRSEGLSEKTKQDLIDQGTIGSVNEITKNYSAAMADADDHAKIAVINAREQLNLLGAKGDYATQEIHDQAEILRYEQELIKEGYSGVQLQDLLTARKNEQADVMKIIYQIAQKTALAEGITKLDAAMESIGARLGEKGFRSDQEKFNDLLADPNVTAEIEARAAALGTTAAAYKELLRQIQASQGATRPRRANDKEEDKGFWSEFKDQSGFEELLSQTDSIGKAYEDLGGIVGNATSQMIEATGAAIGAALVYGDAIGPALQKAGAAILAQIASEAAIKAIYQLAEGFALLFIDPPEATSHFVAAALYGSVAVAAGLAGRAIAPKKDAAAASAGGSSGRSSSGAAYTDFAAQTGNRADPNAITYHPTNIPDSMPGRDHSIDDLARQVQALHEKIGSMSPTDVIHNAGKQSPGIYTEKITTEMRKNTTKKVEFGRTVLAR